MPLSLARRMRHGRHNCDDARIGDDEMRHEAHAPSPCARSGCRPMAFLSCRSAAARYMMPRSSADANSLLTEYFQKGHGLVRRVSITLSIVAAALARMQRASLHSREARIHSLGIYTTAGVECPRSRDSMRDVSLSRQAFITRPAHCTPRAFGRSRSRRVKAMRRASRAFSNISRHRRPAMQRQIATEARQYIIYTQDDDVMRHDASPPCREDGASSPDTRHAR